MAKKELRLLKDLQLEREGGREGGREASELADYTREIW